jgi:glucose/arabinose dehydrogenase
VRQPNAAGWVLTAALAACSLDRSPGEVPELEQPPDAGPPLRPAPLLAFERIEYGEPFTRPTSLAFVPGTEDELLVLEQGGRVLHLQLAGDALRLLGSFEVPDVHLDWDCGLIALELDPAFERNAFLYVSLCLSESTSGIFRFTFDPSDYSAIADSMREILVRGERDHDGPIHNAGTLGFDPQGRMWALFGDKGKRENADDLTSDLGKVLRIVPSVDPELGGYQPAGGAFDENPELFAFGLRSPWRGAMDRRGRLFVGDVGLSTTEEINLVRIGGDYGWPAYEGPCPSRCGKRVNPLVSWHNRDDDPYVLDDEDAAATTRRAAWLGRFLEPTADDPYRGLLTDRLLFGDVCSGFVRVLEVDDRGEVTLDAHVGHRLHLTGIDQARDGHLYAVTYGGCAYDRGRHPGGALWRIVLAQ